MSAGPPLQRACRGPAWIVLFALTFAGQACYRPNQPDCAIACGAGGLCPRGMRCSNGLCARGAVQCPTGLDATSDTSGADLPSDAPGAPADTAQDAAVAPSADGVVETVAPMPDAGVDLNDGSDATPDLAPDLPSDAAVVLSAPPFAIMQDRNDPTTLELYGVDTFGSLLRWGGPGSSGIASMNFGSPSGVVRLAGIPSAVSWEKGRVDVFTRGSDKRLWQRWYHAGVWQKWVLFGEVPFGSDPSITSWGIERLDIFVRGDVDGVLWHQQFDHGWYPWRSRGGQIKSAPAAIALAPHRIDVFARDPADKLVHLAYDGAWLPWEGLADTLLVGPAVTSRKADVIEVYGVRSSQRLEYFEWTPTSRGQWKSTALDVPGDFRVVTLTPRRVLVLSLSEGVAWQRFIDFPE